MDIVFRLIGLLIFLFLALSVLAYFMSRNLRVFVAIQTPYGDGSGGTHILGVYRTKDKADLRISRRIMQEGGMIPYDVVECLVGKDILDADK